MFSGLACVGADCCCCRARCCSSGEGVAVAGSAGLDAGMPRAYVSALAGQDRGFQAEIIGKDRVKLAVFVIVIKNLGVLRALARLMLPAAARLVLPPPAQEEAGGPFCMSAQHAPYIHERRKPLAVFTHDLGDQCLFLTPACRRSRSPPPPPLYSSPCR